MEFKLPVNKTLERLLEQEDTNGDKKITIDDKGPKEFLIKSTDDESYLVEGTYRLSNLLQELFLAKGGEEVADGEATATIPLEHIEEPPVDRISRMIKDYYWGGLTRTMDKDGIVALISDPKNKQFGSNNRLRVYVPDSDEVAFRYYKDEFGDIPIDVIRLPARITAEYVRTLNQEPGILSLKLNKPDGEGYKGAPFVVPGGRFNEMYGWDSYFESVGLLIDDRVDLCVGMADNFQYQIEHYGKILNANRSYFLTRTQPPFYTSMIREIYEKTKDKEWLKRHLRTAIFEYESVWMVAGKRLTASTGLNRYLAEGIGRPPEAEEGHFHHVFGPPAKKAKIAVEVYEKEYDERRCSSQDLRDLDEYFVHDRSVRESGHDTTYRLEGRCADLNVVELNALLYKYEKDFEYFIKEVFEDSFTVDGKTYKSAYWKEKASARREAADVYLWEKDKGMYFDYDFKQGEKTGYVSATTLIPLWAGMASKSQAQSLVKGALKSLTEKGGIVSCTEASRGKLSEDRPPKQWDYPYGWAPHQMMIWRGLTNYGFTVERDEVIYRWLYMITRNAVDHNGTVTEKYDVVEATHNVFAEYGNQGEEFEYITKEGFGWMNASYQYGLSLLPNELRQDLNALKPPEQVVFRPESDKGAGPRHD